ncbi:DUF1622 domain-containing protein [Neolewinella aurantiaca]|uniref:DUF1622 domain-containing protein n=1 Tax=Neolewinella aurantiaca TaxID=2602767 RepID=A0A5C7FFL4_9BACT|nr:DUF1622 domain-containing protein [Neolewinella aurantiaca]TXF84710.1 DUF1622 domain-containing protein [Neolewinella aurantiaca]
MEELLHQAAMWIKLVVEAVGILIVAYGVLSSLFLYGRHLFGSSDVNYLPLRRSLARYLIVALEFQLAADILSTAIAPDWEEIGQLAAIAAIRTVLNYFLEQEISVSDSEDVPAPDEEAKPVVD